MASLLPPRTQVPRRRQAACAAIILIASGLASGVCADEPAYRATLVDIVIDQWRDTDATTAAPRWEAGMRVWLKGLATPDLEQALSVVRYEGLLDLLAAGGEGSAVAETDLSAPSETTGLGYFPLNPCRIVDTRLGGGAMRAGETRYFQAKDPTQIEFQGGKVGGCGVPASAAAVVLNITSTGQGGSGHLRAFPSDAPLPNASLVNFSTTQAIANSTILPICTSACPTDFGIYATNLTQVIVDVSGYFSP